MDPPSGSSSPEMDYGHRTDWTTQSLAWLLFASKGEHLQLAPTLQFGEEILVQLVCG